MTDAYLMVVNEAAGSTEHDTIERARTALVDRVDADHVDVETTSSPEDLDDVVAKLDGRVMVVCGGDGSIHLAVERARAAGVLGDLRFGLIPLGTGNDLARSLSIPLEPEDAAAVVVDGSARALDLVVGADGVLAINAIHAGIGADAASRAQPLKEGLGATAYLLGAIAAGATAPGWDVSVTVDGTPVEPDEGERTLLVAVANGATFGGGTIIAPDARPDDGLLDVIVSRASGPAARAAFGVALRRGTHLDRDDVAHARGREITIQGEPLAYNVDGELEDAEHATRTLRVDAGAWRLVAPTA